MAADRPEDAVRLSLTHQRGKRRGTGPVDLPARAVALRAELESARDHRRTGDRERARSLATDVEKAARRAVRAAEPTLAAELLAIAGSAAVVGGLLRDEEGLRAEARRAFVRAARDLRSVADALPESTARTAELGLALVGTADPVEQAEAVALLRSVVDRGVDDADVWRGLGIALLDHDLPHEAVEALGKATSAAPDDWLAAEALAIVTEQFDEAAVAGVRWGAAAEAMWYADLLDRALGAIERALELNRGDWRIFHVASLIHAAAGGWEQALATAREADRLHPSGTNKRLVAEAFSRTGDVDEAVTVLDSALAEDPADQATLLLKADLLAGVDRFGEVLPITSALRDAGVRDANVDLLHGSALLAAGEVEAAIGALSAAAGLDDGNAVTLARLGFALALDGQLEAGRQHLDRALELEADDLWALSRRAQVSVELGDLDGAHDDLVRAVALGPEIAELYQQLGEVCSRQGDVAGAVAAYDRVTELVPDSGWGWACRGDLLMAAQDFRAARDSYAEAGRLVPDRASVAAAHSEALVLMADPDELPEAERLARKAIALEPGSAAGYHQLSVVLARQARLGDALDALDEAVARDPQNGRALANRGSVLLALERFDEAVSALSDALERVPDDPDILAELGEAYVRAAEEGPKEARSPRLRLAAEHLGRATRRAATHDPDLLELLGRIRLELGDLDEAEAALRAAVRAAPEPGVDALVALGDLLVRRGTPAEALEVLDRARALNADDEDVCLQRSIAFVDLGRPQDAVAELEPFVRDHPDASAVHRQLGEVYRLMGRHDEALRELDLAAAGGVDAWLLATRGATLRQAGRPAEAEQDLRQSLESYPLDAFTRFELTMALDALGRQQEAAELLGRLTEQYPEDTEIRLEYADALRVQGDVARALSTIEEVAWQRPDDPWVLRIMGGILLAAGRHTEAVVSLGRAADIAPDADTLTELADAQERAGMLPEALRTIDLALGHSRSRQALVAKAWMLTFLAAYDEAAVVAREAHTLPPHDASAATVLAWALEHIGADPREIVAITGEAAERNPADPQAHKAHANALWLAGSADADTAYERAIELFDTGGDLDDTARHTKGWCLYRLRRYDEATELYLRVLVTQYEDPMSLMFDIGLAALEMGDAERAVAKYDTGLGLVSDADLRGRGQLAVGAFDLRQAVRRGLIPASPLVDDLLTRLEGRLARMPEYVRLEPVSIVKRPG